MLFTLSKLSVKRQSLCLANALALNLANCMAIAKEYLVTV